MMQKLSMDDLNRISAEEFKRSEKAPVIAVLENIRSAYNVGSVFRTADAFLLEAIYITGYTCVPPHKEIKKTALGAEESVDWKHFTNATEAATLVYRNDEFQLQKCSDSNTPAPMASTTSRRASVRHARHSPPTASAVATMTSEKPSRHAAITNAGA